MRFLFFIFLLFCCSNSFGQLLKGNVTDTIGKPIVGVSVILKDPKLNRIFNFSTTDSSGNFSIGLRGGDSLMLFFSHVAFKELKFSLNEIRGNSKMKIVLKASEKYLDELTIKSRQPVHVNGDTTFIAVDAFKQNTDHKLTDLVERIPGLEKTKDGKLLYNKKPIEKITIEGEDLFADKTALLLNNVATYAIDELQILQNQLENSKLKGMEEGNKTYLNLKLKKNRLRTGFGDAESGLNTKGRGLVKFTNFTLAPQIKIGIIGGFESLGQSTTLLEDELADIFYKEQKSWMLSEPSIETFYNLPDVYYKFNNLSNARLKINTSFNKKWSSETEFNFLSDRQSQKRQLNELVLDTSGFIPQERFSDLLNKPLWETVNEKLHWDISSNKDLKILMSYKGNFSKSEERTQFLRLNKADSTRNLVKNSNNYFNVDLDYLSRLSISKALRLKCQFYFGDFQQELSGMSANYYNSFDILQTGIGKFLYPSNLTRTGVQLQLIKLVKSKMRYSYGAIVKYDRISNDNKASLQSLSTNSSYDISYLNNKNIINLIAAKLFITLPLFIHKFPLTLNANGGLQFVSQKLPDNKSSFLPTYEINLSARKQRMPIYYNFELKFYNQVPAIISFNPFYRPFQFNEFRITAQPLRSLDYQMLNVSGKLWKSKFIPSLNFRLTRETSGFGFKQTLKPNIRIITDSLLNKPVYDGSISAFWYIIQYKTGTTVKVDMNCFWNQTRVLSNKQVFVQQNFNLNGSVSFSKEWKKKFFSNADLKLDYYMPSRNKFHAIPFANILNWNLAWKNKYQFGKNTSLGLDATYFKTNATSGNAIDFTSLDFLGDYSIPKSSFNVSFIVQNILNEKDLSFGDQSPTYQSIYRIPLLGINFLLKFRYEL